MSGRAAAGCALLVVLTWAGPAPTAAAAPAPAAAGEQLVPDEPVGGHPASRYEIWYSPGGTFDLGSKALGLATELVFGVVRVFVGLAAWMITWAYSFRFAAALAEPAGRLAEAYQDNLIGPAGLAGLALFVAVVYAGVHVLRNRLTRGVGELLVSLLVLGLGGMLLVNPAAAFRSGVGVAASLSGVMLELATPGGASRRPPAPDRGVDAFDVEAVTPLTEGLRQAFVAQPHDLLNWGSVLDGQCAAQREQILAEGPHGSDERPRELMAAGGPACEPHVAFNERATVERLLGAVLVLTAALVVLVALVLVAVTVVVAQLVAVALVAVMPFAVVGGVLPGGGRQLLWRWAAACLQTVAVIVAMAGLLGFLLLTADALLADASQGLLERFGLLVVVAVALVLLRRKVLRGTQSMVRNLDRRLESARVGGTHGGGWMRPSAAGGVSGFGVAQMAADGEADWRELRRHGHLPRSLHHLRLRPHPASGNGSGGDATARSRLGRAGHAAAAAAGGTLKTAANLTVNLPRAAPRGVARAQVAISDRTAALQARLHAGADQARATAAQWRDGLAHPVGATRRERSRLEAERAHRHRQAAAGTQLAAVARRGAPPREGDA